MREQRSLFPCDGSISWGPLLPPFGGEFGHTRGAQGDRELLRRCLSSLRIPSLFNVTLLRVLYCVCFPEGSSSWASHQGVFPDLMAADMRAATWRNLDSALRSSTQVPLSAALLIRDLSMSHVVWSPHTAEAIAVIRATFFSAPSTSPLSGLPSPWSILAMTCHAIYVIYTTYVM
ncbi:hypothetical protein LZ32DRAFT_68791 [Colletotrichum eremochloae]|nr:hypothetical protein LZ32DRAFT_68791 [Colletotrichum eremochloae]